nr:hypothetical protein [candidate division Zixibacteria bacterium]
MHTSSASKKRSGKSHKHSQSDYRIGLILLILAIAIHIAMAVWFNFTQDDAYISFRYVENYLDGHGLVFNAGEHIEGYTNFLWTIILVLARMVGFNIILFSKIMGVICGVGTIIILYFLSGLIIGNERLYRGMIALILGSALSFAYWTISGLETAAFSAAMTASLYLYLKRSHLTGPLLVLATLLRPEGGLLFMIIIIYEMVVNRRLTSLLVGILSVYVLSLLPYMFFKIVYYGGVIPNTFYAKTGLSLDKLADGLEYVAKYFWHYLGAGVFLLPALYYLKKSSQSVKSIALISICYLAYIILIGGDVLKVHRFFVPVMPLIILFMVYGLSLLIRKKALTTGILVLLIIWQTIIPIKHVIYYYIYEVGLTSKLKHIADNLKSVDKSDFSLAISTIGIVGYELNDHRIIDLLGLTDSVIARHPEEPVSGMETTWKERKFNSAYVLSQKPDYIMFSTGSKPSAPAERSLCLYSAFLKNYRAIGFYFDGFLHDVFKRYHDIDKPPVMDIPPAFVGYFTEGFNKNKEGDVQGSYNAYRQASQIVPDTLFPYTKYYMSDILKDNGYLDDGYRLLKEVYSHDTLVYTAILDLCMFENRIRGDREKAIYYRDKMAVLMPWYIPRLDSLLNR